MKHAFLLLSTCAVLAVASAAGATTLRVPSEYPTINAALDTSVSGDSVLVAPGVYTDYETRPGDRGDLRTSCAWLKGGVTLISEDGPGLTTIKLAGGTVSLRVIYAWPPGDEVWVEGFTVTGPLPQTIGAWIEDGAGATFTNCVFRDMGTGSSFEFALHARDSRLTVIGCQFLNLFGSSSGAIIAVLANLWVEDSHFENCRTGTVFSNGGEANHTTTVRNSTFTNNFSDNAGGSAISVHSGRAVEISGCLFVENESRAVSASTTGAAQSIQIRDNRILEEPCEWGRLGRRASRDGRFRGSDRKHIPRMHAGDLLWRFRSRLLQRRDL